MCRISVDSLMDLSDYMPTLIDATYDTGTFLKIDYVFINEKLYKKEFVKSRVDKPRDTRIFADSSSLQLKETTHINVRLNALESYMMVIQVPLEYCCNSTRTPVSILESFDFRWEEIRRMPLILLTLF